MNVTVNQMVGIVRESVKGTSMVTVDLDSPMDKTMRKTGNPFINKGIVKRETLNGTIGYIYSNAVNNLALKEDKDIREAKQHPWGDMDEKHLFRINRKTGKPYLSMQVKNVTVHGFFMPDGTEVNETEIRQFIPEKNKSSTQEDLTGEVIVRDYSMDNIRKIRAFGTEFDLMIEVAQEVTETAERVTVRT